MNTIFDQCQINVRNDFSTANFSKSSFIRTAVGESSFRTANFSNAFLEGSRFFEADVSDAYFKNTEVDRNTVLPKNMTDEQKEGLVY